MQYIHQQKDWPRFTWNTDELMVLLGRVRNLQGRLTGKMESLGFNLRDEALLRTLTLDVLKSSEIEGEKLPPAQVRSSVARRLGMEIPGLIRSEKNIDGIVDMMLNATRNYTFPLTKNRLFAWHLSMFPQGKSGLYRITAGKWRKDANGPMQVVSGGIGHERVHFQAPDASKVDSEMKRFISWFNSENRLEPVLKSAVAHLWFITIHPFEDGNGRIARALSDLLLARSDGSSQRYYSMSAQIRLERKSYYDILEKTQRGTLDITGWLAWYLHCLLNALKSSEEELSKILEKGKFWSHHAETSMNERQRLMVNKLLDSFRGKLTSSKWATITKCSADTALRDIQDLISKGILAREDSGGRSTNYILISGN